MTVLTIISIALVAILVVGLFVHIYVDTAPERRRDKATRAFKAAWAAEDARLLANIKR
jgi:hypothetical protein